MLHNGNEFTIFTELHDTVLKFKQAECVQLYIRRFRSIISAAMRSFKKEYNEDFKYSELEYYIHEGKLLRSPHHAVIGQNLSFKKFDSMLRYAYYQVLHTETDYWDTAISDHKVYIYNGLFCSQLIIH